MYLVPVSEILLVYENINDMDVPIEKQSKIASFLGMYVMSLAIYRKVSLESVLPCETLGQEYCLPTIMVATIVKT